MEYPIVIKDYYGRVVDRVGNAETAAAVMYGDLKYRDLNGPYTVEVPDGDQWDATALQINGEIRLNADCYGFIILDRMNRV